jgi:ApbE superfamily uncharacterized protein (UPF0280 family)
MRTKLMATEKSAERPGDSDDAATPEDGHPLHATRAGIARAIASLPHGAFAGRLESGSLFLQHGPINLVINIDGTPQAVIDAEAQLFLSFPRWLGELVDELPRLRAREQAGMPLPNGIIARAMTTAVIPFSDRFVTPMAAVAGAVSDAAVSLISRVPQVRRAIVNNGGDIALWLSPGERARVGVITSDNGMTIEAALDISHDSAIRGVATSGWRGRSMSFGIADAVTVVASTAAMADAAATVIASATNITDPAVIRQPANELEEDSELGKRLVTVDVGHLTASACQRALNEGLVAARRAIGTGIIAGVALSVQGRWATAGQPLNKLQRLSIPARNGDARP